MCGKFWDLLEIVANSRHYLHTTEMRLCGYLNNINIRTRDGKEQNMNDGNITAWYDYLSKNRIKEVYFRAELVKIESNEEYQANPDWEIWCVTEDDGTVFIFDCYVEFLYRIGDWYQVLRERVREESDYYENYSFNEKALKQSISCNMAYAEKTGRNIAMSQFAMALRVLEGKYTRKEIDEEIDELAPFILPQSYKKDAQRIMDALRCMQVFYGMGNWGDGAAPNEMIEELYEQYIRAALWAINEGDK